MAENTETKTTKGSTNVSKAAVTDAVGGESTSTTSSNPAVNTVGGLVVPAPLDAPAGAPQGGNIGMPDTENVQVTAPKGEKAGYPLKVTVDNHTHAGQRVKKHSTIMLDLAEYRWALEAKVGVPGDKADVGFEVTDAGDVIKPENEKTLEELEAAAIEAAKGSDETETAA